MDAINLEAKFALFSEHSQASVVGQFNGHDLLLAKALGEFVWHKHDDTDDFFLVVKGTLVIEMRQPGAEPMRTFGASGKARST